MKKLQKILSYVLVAALSSALTLGLTYRAPGESSAGQSKLDQLEELILTVFVGEADKTAMEDAAATAMVEALGDRWSYYISAAEYDDYMDQMANAYVGIGVTIQQTSEEEGLLVTKVNEGGPADQAGMLPEDRIIGVNGVDIVGMDVNTVSKMVKGEENTQVAITVLRDGQKLTLDITRMKVQTPVATARMLEDNIGLITIVNFDSRCADETIAAMEQLMEQGADKLIFDVRFNPGGYAHELVEVLDYILPEGDLFRTVDYSGKEDVDTSDAKCIEGIPMAVLVNGESYSAAEFFAAALSEYGYAFIVGEPTVGKGYYQVTYKLNDGSAAGISIGKYYTPNGVSLAEEGGIVPDILITVDEETAAYIYAGTLDPEEDPQIQAAVEALKE